MLISGDLYQQTTRFVKNISTKSYLTEEGSRGPAAAHAYVRAAHVARLLSQQEAHSLGGFLRRSESPERDLGKVKVISDVVDEGRVRHARGHRVDADPVRRELLHGARLERVQSAFAGGVQQRPADHRAAAADVDDGAARAVFLA